MKKMTRNLPETAIALLRRAGEAAEERGERAYLVGGPVRDMILGRPNLDLDVTVVGDGIAVGKALAHELKTRRIYIYRKYGTCTLKFPGGISVDFATARSESYAKPGAMPKVRPGTLSDDLRRRDFTINAMAVGLNGRNFGDLADPFGGLRDIKAGKIRVMHKKSFLDDPTRIFRAVRFGIRLGFDMDATTLRLARAAASLGLVDSLEPYRIHNELKKVAEEKASAKMFKALDALLSKREAM
jgi:tRNA nucleotidyltransferase (CCA-adding enzyme)